MDARELEQRVAQMRTDIVAMIAEAGSGHPGGSLSCIDVLAVLYLGGVLGQDPADPAWPGRDRFVMAKGHAAPALYTALAHAGYFPREELMTLRKLGTRLQGHPDCKLLPGVEVSTGSLGQGLSVAAGMACGLRDGGQRVFCLLGDGECEEGQVWEAAMFAAHEKLGNLVAIVDANGLQIDGDVHDVVQTGTLGEKFAAFGWGVTEVDGHDLEALAALLARVKAAGGDKPHCIIAHTVKGKGVSFMEGQAGWHGKAPDAGQRAAALAELGGEVLAPCDVQPHAAAPAPSAGEEQPASPVALASDEERAVKRATRAAFGPTLVELAEEGVPVVAVDADLSGSTTTAKFGAAYPERHFNVGIAEQNMTDVAAGLALAGNVAFTGSFAVFGTGRAYDQIRNTVCYSGLNVKICPTHAGISVGPDGGSHQMLEDVGLMRGLPGMTVLVPADYAAARAAIRVAAATPGPVYVRMGRENVPAVYADGVQLQAGRAYVLREGADVTVFANGVMVREALQAADELAAQGISAQVVDVFSVKPLDERTILGAARATGRVVVAEEHSMYGGLCSAVSELLARTQPMPAEFVAMRDAFGKSGSYAQLKAHFAMDAAAIAAAAQAVLRRP